MQPTAFFRLRSNRSPEKYGFQQIKKRIHVLGYTLLGLDITQISKMDFERISVKLWWHFVAALPS
jgi:hypothetical protein